MNAHLNKLLYTALWSAMLIGLYGALSISYRTITGVEVCPSFLSMRVCFLVALAYSLLMVAVFLNGKRWAPIVFIISWLVVFGFALPGSIMEFIQGNTCPRTGAGIPLCYISLALSVIVGASWAGINRERVLAPLSKVTKK